MWLIVARRGTEVREAECFDRTKIAPRETRPPGFLSFLFRNQRTRFRSLVLPFAIGSQATGLKLEGEELGAVHVYFVQEDGKALLLPALGETLLKGKPLTGEAQVGPGARFTVGSWQLTLGLTPALTDAEQQELRAGLAQLPAALQVLADQAEERGEADKAQWLKLERTVTWEPSARRASAARERLAELAATLTPTFRATWASGPVRSCDEKACPGSWPRLEVTSDPRLRECRACHKTVVYCARPQETHSFLAHQHPHVLDAAHDPVTTTGGRPLTAVG